ncbi:MAG: tRNA (N6-threonylcarbamoyladenosine(37)-N6)-methyltransferase TrmO [Candidatus Thorarchaeota archaeon]
MPMKLTQIGEIRSPFKDSKGTPIQPPYSTAKGEVVLNDEYAEGLHSLGGFSHMILIYWFHKTKNFDLQVTPYLDDSKHGIFSIRAPSRPNPIGLSVVRILEISKNKILFEGADILDGTPLLDIKPYVPEFDSYPGAKSGWLTSRFSKNPEKKADQRFQAT